MSARWRAVAAVVVVSLATAGCGSSSSSTSTSSSSHHGSVSVLYAGSLADLMEHELGPAFSHADGYSYEGVGAGSTELAAQIKAKVRRGDVFISASPKADVALEGASDGHYVNWYAMFATAPLVIGYSSNSSFAAQFKTKPWYDVVTEPGIRVGRTDPKLDPKGKLTVEALESAAAQLRMPALKAALSKFETYPEQALVGRLQAGQLDAGFFYSVEAAAARIPTVSIAPAKGSATYTAAILKGAPNQAGAEAFVSYLLGPGTAALSSNGLTLVKPTLTGSVAAVPSSLRSLVVGG